ncbi:MAG: hypothetical protein INR62_00165 [Rhodospirillales bacterium]|nr:hypothetical protein [Acetobacter sp.]
MKTAPSRFGRRAAWMLGAFLLFANTVAQACPGCKQTEGAPLNGDSVGFGLSIFFMLFMIVGVLSGLGYMMYRSCRVLAARDALELAEDSEVEESVAPASRTGDVAPMPGGWMGGLAHGRS